ncbi:MAG TPA: protein-glutamate O-methyltransferase CheR [Gemmataceae bacterium]|nr:protein-glutamate O-methyltransferase CheR [Gemmataceae bacterium]
MSWTHPAYEAVVRFVGERTGLSFAPQRHDSAEQGIRRAMARAGITDLGQYRALLQRDARALDDLIVELTVGETYFFREPGQFDFIRRTVLPDLWRRRGLEHGVRAWSAGCASGEEAYSLAILFAEEGFADRTYLLATDISRAALARAHEAAYGNWSLRGSGATTAAPYLTRRGNLHVLQPRIRRAVLFEYLNLALDVYPSFASGTWGMDLILCRNVLIYFEPETVRGVAHRLFESLAPGGWLITAASDPPLGGDAPYEIVMAEEGVFYRRPLAEKETGPEAGRPARGDRESTSPVPSTDLPARGTQYSVLSTQYSSPPSPVAVTSVDPLAEAGAAFARGDYARAAEVASRLTADPSAAALYVRALANLDAGRAERACAEAAARHPLAAELHHLHALLLLELGRDEEADRAARRVIYLDRTLALGHFTLGSILWRRGDRAGARRAYRNARALCAARPADEVVPLSDGERAGRLAEAAAAQLAILDATPEVTP